MHRLKSKLIATIGYYILYACIQDKFRICGVECITILFSYGCGQDKCIHRRYGISIVLHFRGELFSNLESFGRVIDKANSEKIRSYETVEFFQNLISIISTFLMDFIDSFAQCWHGYAELFFVFGDTTLGWLVAQVIMRAEHVSPVYEEQDSTSVDELHTRRDAYASLISFSRRGFNSRALSSILLDATLGLLFFNRRTVAYASTYGRPLL